MTRSLRSADGRGSAERALTVELTALALARTSPDELVVLDETAEEYFADPAALLRPDEGDIPLGSGVTVAMMTPYLLAASSAVLPVLGTIAGELGKDVTKDLVKDPVVSWIRSLFKRRPTDPPGPDALTAEQTAHVRDAVLAQCHALGLPSGRAALIADATIGSLHVRP